MDRELAPGKNEARIVELDGKWAVEIELQHGKACLVDFEDWDLVRHYRWHWKWENRKHNKAQERLYVASTIWDRDRKRHCMIRMHRLIMDTPRTLMVDHVDSKETLDNRRSNLRLGTNSNNQANSGGRGAKSGYKNVSWNKRKRKFCGIFMHQRKAVFVGYFDDPEEAARAVDAKAKEIRGEFARLNFPDMVQSSAEIASESLKNFEKIDKILKRLEASGLFLNSLKEMRYA